MAPEVGGGYKCQLRIHLRGLKGDTNGESHRLFSKMLAARTTTPFYRGRGAAHRAAETCPRLVREETIYSGSPWPSSKEFRVLLRQ